jgi:hypothetical protein
VDEVELALGIMAMQLVVALHRCGAIRTSLDHGNAIQASLTLVRVSFQGFDY